ncbi:hypothetical protein JHK82_043199 [Glycine max]|nr:hypothetical protein JHK82_043199 [Glycine max]
MERSNACPLKQPCLILLWHHQNHQCLSFEAALFDSSLASSKLCIYTFTESEYPLASLEQHIEQLKRQKTNNKCVAPALAAKPPQHKQQQQQQQQK